MGVCHICVTLFYQPCICQTWFTTASVSMRCYQRLYVGVPVKATLLLSLGRASDMNCLLVYCDCTHHSWPPSGKHFMSAVSSRVTSRHEGKRGHHWRETAVINTLWSGIATATREWSVRYYITLSAWQTYEGVKCRILYYINVATKKCGVRFFTLSPGQRRSEV